VIDANLARLSDHLFWVSLVIYAVAMVAFFASMAYRARRVATAATVITIGGALVHATSIATRGVAAGRVPWGNMFEYSNMLGMLLVVIYLLVLDRRLGLRQLGGFVLGAATLSLAVSRFVYAPAGPLVPALESYWLKFHVFAAISGSTLFGVSFIFTVLYLIRDAAERRAGASFGGSTVGAAFVGTDAPPAEGQPADLAEELAARDAVEVKGFAGHLPSADRLDTLAHRTIQFAFPVWTFAVIAGAIWAHEAWGRYWGWDPKETWAFVTWVVYAGYLHARATSGWRARKAAVISCVGFAAVSFTYWAVNLWISGLHSYAK
jgi:cytochrome c-type biogenesis protein CcsB